MTAITEALSDVVGYGVAASRTAAGIQGRLYYATDTFVLSRDNGTSWNTLSLGAALTVEEVDGSPTDAAITKIVFPNGTLAIVGHVATYTPAGGGGGSLSVSEVDGSPTDSAVTALVFPNDTLSIASHVATIRAVPTGDMGCKVYKASTQTISNNSTTDCTFDSESWDTDGFAASGTNSGRPTIPAGLSGRYLVIGKWEWDANTSGVRLQYLTISGAQVEADFQTASQGDRSMGTIAAIVNLSAGDIISMSCYQNSGGNRTMTATIALHKLGSGRAGGAIGCSLKRTTTQGSLAAATYNPVQFTSEDFDTDSFHDNSTNPSRVTIPAGLGGKYLLTAAFTVNQTFFQGFKKNGSPFGEARGDFASGKIQGYSQIMDLAAGDYVEAYEYHGSGTGTVAASSEDDYPRFQVARLDSGTSAAALAVSEVDGSPSNSAITALVVPNDSLSISGSTATLRQVPFGFIGCKATRTTTQSISNTTLTAIAWDTESGGFDTDGFHDPVTNNTRFTIPAGLGGKYLLTTNVTFASGGGAERYLEFFKNGTTQLHATDIALNSSVDSYGNLTAVVDLAAGDYIEVRVYQDSGGSKNLQQSVRTPWFEMVKLESGSVGGGIGCRASNSGNISATGSTDNIMTLDTERFDTDGFHSTSSNTGRMTIPAGLSGKYAVVGDVFASGAGSGDYIAIRLNGSTFVAVQSCAGSHNTIATEIDLVTGDYIELVYNPSTGRTVSSLSIYSPSLSIMRLDSGNIGAPGTLLGKTSYMASGDNTISVTATSDADVDATNLKVDFTAPSSGNVIVKISSLYNDGNNNAHWTVREGSTTLGENYMSSQVNKAMRGIATIPLTGLASGSHTFKMGAYTNSGTMSIYHGSSSAKFGPIVIEVWAA